MWAIAPSSKEIKYRVTALLLVDAHRALLDDESDPAESTLQSRRFPAWPHRPDQATPSPVSSAPQLERTKMALAKKKRVGKRTISAKQVRKTASGRKRRKADGTQPSKVVFPASAPAAS
ncbi:hypothetical protein [Rhizobacter sp. Root404]|uniref:hypothetical protein n=1 Tax=Rhizobacter sp. Root404 TaxID=1736528 RepID=UPI00138F96CB|nr:hypothetical protein [Rhizobacter sp. Root404]